jgi:hypothetical protein
MDSSSLDLELGLWFAPDPNESPEITKFGHDGTLSIRNFALMMGHLVGVA